MGLLKATVIVKDDGALTEYSSAHQAQVLNSNHIERIVPAVCGPQNSYSSVNSQIIYLEGYGRVSYYVTETTAALWTSNEEA